MLMTFKTSKRPTAMGLLPTEGKFFDYFEQLSEKIEEGGLLFSTILDEFATSEGRLTRIKEIEKEADKITLGIYQKLHQTFITPLDREDIYALAHEMDTILDVIVSAATRMYVYKMKHITPELKEIAHILNNSICEVKRAACLLRNDKKNARELMDICININSLENEADYVLRQAMASLFQNEKDAKELLKMKEIYERVEGATDVCEDVSNIIEGIVLKHG